VRLQAERKRENPKGKNTPKEAIATPYKPQPEGMAGATVKIRAEIKATVLST